MKSNNLTIKVFFLLSLLVFGGCNDDEFLETEPKTFYTLDNIFTTSAQVDQVIVTLYSDLRNFWTKNYQLKGNGTDVLGVPQFRINSTFADYSLITPEDDRFNNVFYNFHKQVARANQAIYAAELEQITWDSEEEKAYVLAQARFFKALAYGKMAEIFGGVPLTKKLQTEPRYDYVRASRAETYQYAIDELEAIVNDLPEIAPQPGRLVKGAALHYLSEFYLGLGIETSDNNAYQQAINYASEVIDGGTFSLMTERFGTRANEEDKNVWWDLFRKGNINYSDGNLESIWAFQIDYDAYVAQDYESYLNYPRYFIPVLRGIPGVEGTAEDVGGRGVAFHAPTKYVENEIWQGTLSEGDIRNSEVNIQRSFYYNNPSDPNYGQLVPRAEIDAANAGQGWIYPIFWKITTDQFTGLDEGQDRSNIFRDDYVIRLAETILLRAEAYYRAGNSGAAAEDLNRIRLRANAEPITAADVDIDFILDERARELWTEEIRWATLLRMGATVAVDRIRKYALHDVTRTTLTFDYNLWPIPQKAIDRNKDVPMEQNPGWAGR